MKKHREGWRHFFLGCCIFLLGAVGCSSKSNQGATDPNAIVYSLPNGGIILIGGGSVALQPPNALAPGGTFAVLVGEMPPGFTINPSTGVISGNPTAPFSGVVTIQVTYSNGSTVSVTVNFDIQVAQPTITSITPAIGPMDGFNLVRIIGTNFLNEISVTFGGVICANIIVISSTELTCTPISHAAGLVNVRVQNPTGHFYQLENAYRYVSPPALTFVSPGSGFVTGGFTVTLTGADFLAGATVMFGTVVCRNVTLVSSTSLTCVMDASPSTGVVRVTLTNGDGQVAILNNGFTFTSVSPWRLMTGSSLGTRASHTAVWTGTRMIVWGGLGNLTPQNNGAQYDPVSDSWTSVATTTLQARYSHTAVWTGTRMIVWGGSSVVNGAGSIFNDGKIYDPVQNTWSDMTSTNAPTGRYTHTATLAAGKMMVWGGWNGTTSLGTGGVYDPQLDSWVATNNTGAPTARSEHSAVYSSNIGSVVIFGGGGPVNTGSRYGISTATWSAMTMVDAPVARYGHLAIWTGSRMLVWGGQGASGYLGSGGSYDPAADVWTTMTASGAPVARANATGVWTGTEWLIWGGRAASYFNDGGRYSPSTDSWTSISNASANVAAPRRNHTAVWTGASMVVWGGEDASAQMEAGRVYTP